MSGDQIERRGDSGRRWVSDRRLWPDQRIQTLPIGGPDRRHQSRRDFADRRGGSRRAA